MQCKTCNWSQYHKTLNMLKKITSQRMHCGADYYNFITCFILASDNIFSAFKLWKFASALWQLHNPYSSRSPYSKLIATGVEKQSIHFKPWGVSTMQHLQNETRYILYSKEFHYLLSNMHEQRTIEEKSAWDRLKEEECSNSTIFIGNTFFMCYVHRLCL